MIRLARRASLLVVFLLPAAVATAFAEGAWVLWQRHQMANVDKEPGTTPAQWEALGGYSLEGACRQAVIHQSYTLDQIYKAAVHQPNVSVLRTDDAVQMTMKGREAILLLTFKWLCLPDTVDPREPKGK